MALTKRVHFLIAPEQFETLEAITRRRRPTGERMTVGSLIREAITEYLAKRGVATERQFKRRKRSRPSR